MSNGNILFFDNATFPNSHTNTNPTTISSIPSLFRVAFIADSLFMLLVFYIPDILFTVFTSFVRTYTKLKCYVYDTTAIEKRRR